MRHQLWNAIVTFVFLVFLVLPVASYVAGMRSDPDFEFRDATPFPRPEIERVLDPKFYDEMDKAIRDRNPIRRYYVAGYTNIVYFLTGEVESKRVAAGKDHWLFIDEELRPECSGDETLKNWASNVKALQDSIEARGKRFVFTIAPDKITVYPEMATKADQMRASCSRQNLRKFQGLLADLGVQTIDVAENLDAAKKTGEHVLYSAQDTHWNEWGASVFSSAVLRWIDPPIAIGPFSDRGSETHVPDLSRMSGLFWSEDGPVVRSRPQGLVDIHREPKTATGERPVMISTSRLSDGETLVPLKVAFVHDSFIYVAWNQFGEYLQSIQFLHWATLDAAQLKDIVDESDVVVFETVQRETWNRLQTLFSDDSLAKAVR